MNDSIFSPLKTQASETVFPKVVIVGRPNVGKSTLFNRFLKQRRAITDPTPGVTRDPIEAKAEIEDNPVILIDTGGYSLGKGDMDYLVTQKSLHAIEGVDIILFLVAAGEITAEDESFIERLRPLKEKVVFVANKADSPQKDDLVWNYYAYGFDTVIPISAAHGRNIDVLEEEIVKRLHARPAVSPADQTVPSRIINIAILGKPNTGKSTLTNSLTGSDHSIVSHLPGTTRDVIEGMFEFRGVTYRVLDTAGIRRKKSITENVEYYSVNRAIKSIQDADIVFLLLDAEEGVTDQEKKIAAQIVKKGRGVILTLNKWDKMENIPNQFEAVKDKIRFFFPVLNFAPIIPISAKYNTGIEQLLKTAGMVYRELDRRIDTPRLNRKLQQWMQQYQPPQDGKRKYKIRYMTQVRTNPVGFVLFVNRKEKFPQQYISFVKNKLRKELGFHHIPISLELRER
jgi:GTPase